MNKTICTVMMTALLVLLMAGSAMCQTYDSSVTLENKDDSWQPIDDDISGLLTYDNSSDTFDWTFTATVPEDGCYALIYYADKPDRFVNWGGNNPGALIAYVYATDGIIDTSGSTDLGMNLPHPNDENIAPCPDYCEYNNGHDDFDHCCGAKMWLVPTEALPNPYPGDGEWKFWNAAGILFETDLIWYDDTNENCTPIIKDVIIGDALQAGVPFDVKVVVHDNDGTDDLETMKVVIDFGNYSNEDPVTLSYAEMCDHTCNGTDSCVRAVYTGSVIVTVAHEETCYNVTATDPSELNDTFAECVYVDPGQCAQLVIEGPDKALTRSYSCFDGFLTTTFDFLEYPFAADLIVTCVDEYGNPTEDCNCDMEFSKDSVSASLSSCHLFGSYVGRNCAWCVKVTDWYTPETVIVTADCVCSGTDVESASHDVTFLNPIADLYVTSDPGFLYEITDPECGDDLDCTNVSAQLIDEFGEPILMPDVLVRFAVNGCWYGKGAYTDDSGIATIPLCMTEVYDDEISVSAYSVCNKGSMTIDVVEPVIGEVIIKAPEVMTCDSDPEKLKAVCYTNHSTEMCCPACPPAIWKSLDDLGTINETGYFAALDSGTAIVEVNVSGVIGTTEIVINCPENCTEYPNQCQTYPYAFVVTSGSVSLSGNFTEAGYACVTAIGDPIEGQENDTRGAMVEVSEDTTENVTLDLAGEGNTWMQNDTTMIYSWYANGAVSEVSSGRYALVTSSEPICTEVTIDPAGPFDIYIGNAITFSVSCIDQYGDEIECSELEWHSDNETVGEIYSGIFEGYATGTANVTATGCGVSNSVRVNVAVDPDPAPTPTQTVRRSSSGGGGTYPPDPAPTPEVGNATDNETDQDDPSSSDTKPADAKPTVNLPGDDKTLDTTPDDKDKSSGGYDPTNAILLVLALLAVCVIGYVIYQKSQK